MPERDVVDGPFRMVFLLFGDVIQLSGTAFDSIIKFDILVCTCYHKRYNVISFIPGEQMIEPSSPVPLYFQLQEIIRGKILSGEYPPGELIPSEKDLQKMYGVSRITVRNAINGLVFDDLLIKKQGYGTMVAFPRMLEDGNSRLKSFSEKMAGAGAEISTVVLSVLRIPATERIAGHLGIPVGEDIIYAKRLRKVDGEPLALFENYICTGTGVSENDDFSGSVYKLFEDKYGLVISGAEKIIEADLARSEDAALLQIPSGGPILIIRYTTFGGNGKAVEYAEGIYRADRYKYTVKLKR